TSTGWCSLTALRTSPSRPRGRAPSASTASSIPRTSPPSCSSSSEHGAGHDAVGEVGEDLGPEGQVPDRAEPPADDAQVEGGYGEAGGGTGGDRMTAGEQGGQHHPPSERDGGVGGDAEGEEQGLVVGPRGHDPSH